MYTVHKENVQTDKNKWFIAFKLYWKEEFIFMHLLIYTYFFVQYCTTYNILEKSSSPKTHPILRKPNHIQVVLQTRQVQIVVT